MPIINSIIVIFNDVTIVAVVNLISVIGFIITIFVAVKVSNINKYYQFIGREDLRINLSAHASNISQYLNDFDDHLHQINKELTLTEVTARSLKNKSNRQIKQSLGQVLKLIRSYNNNEPNEQKLRDIYLRLIKADREISDHIKNHLWETSR